MTNNQTATLSEGEKHQHHIEGGYKATLSNPNSSEEAKKHAQEMLDKIAKGEKVEAANPTRDVNMTEGEKHQHHIEGGYKATLSNPKSSEEAKKHAQEMLDKLARGEELSAEDKVNSSNYAAAYTEEEKHRHHVAGGYKATLKNANASDLAKKEARDKLKEMGEEYDESEDKSEDKSGHKRSAEKESSKASSPKKSKKDPSQYTEEEKHNHHVAGGYKATLKNANASEEAKKNAREKLSEMGAEYQSEEESEEKDTKRSEESESGKGKQGFASMPKEKVQEIASKGGRTAHAGEEPAPKKSDESGSKKSKKDPSEYTEEEKHNHHVAGGYKATLKNPNSSEEAKKNAREKLSEMGAEYQEDESEDKEEKKDTKESDKEEKSKSGKGKQGFASMPKEKVQEIASKGGRTKHAGEEPSAVKQQ